jgi:sec-independent protein translocase protein TatB
MFGIGTGEILLLLIVALIVLGPERMPKLARDLGRAVAEFRKTSDELRGEFLNADKYLEAVASPPAGTPAIAEPSAIVSEPQTTPAPVDEPAPPVEQAAPEPDETAFDREAREARERLRDPARAEQAKAEGWKTPTDEAGTSERWG